MKKNFLGFDYFEKLKKIPDVFSNSESPLLFMQDVLITLNGMKSDDDSERFCSIKKRGFVSNLNVTRISRNAGLKWQSASQTYKGLLNFKTPFDLQLYSSLIWELKPKTIIEFGSLQGGSALWFADQLEINEINGFVHSFDLFPEAVHENAKKTVVLFFIK